MKSRAIFQGLAMRYVLALLLMMLTAMPSLAAEPSMPNEYIVVAGGCFWGMQAVFEHVKGVTHVTAGYAGGERETASYHTVSTGTTGHAESVQITYNPAQVSLDDLIKVFFTVAHDPTQLNGQNPDTGTQYRSAIFFATPEQQKAATDTIEKLNAQKTFGQPVVTEVSPLKGFYPAEDYHQDYAARHPDDTYIAFYDLPKVKRLEKQLPDLYVQKPVTF